MDPATTVKKEENYGYVLLDLLAGCTLMVLVLLPLLGELHSWLLRRGERLRRYMLHAEVMALRDTLRFETVQGVLRARMGGGEVSVVRGEQQIWRPPQDGRTFLLRWQRGEEVDWVHLEAEEDGVRTQVSLPLPTTF